jgi:hypothetical protein
VSDSARIGLTARERRELSVRFVERIAPELRRELDGLVRRRGDVARRAAERMQPIELVADDLERGDVRIVAAAAPPRGAVRDRVRPPRAAGPGPPAVARTPGRGRARMTMAGPDPPPVQRLSSIELKVLKIAAHRQLRRWNNVELHGELRRPERRDSLRRAVRVLDGFPAGVELRAAEPE